MEKQKPITIEGIEDVFAVTEQDEAKCSQIVKISRLILSKEDALTLLRKIEAALK